MRKLLFLLIFLPHLSAGATIPATPVMTLYQFNSALDMPYYRADRFQESGSNPTAGTLAQGTSVIPCLMLRNGTPLTDRQGTPYVGFQIVVNSRTATPAATETFRRAVRSREQALVINHHCDDTVQHVISIRTLYSLKKPPFFDPPLGRSGFSDPSAQAQGDLDAVVRAFHNSADCATVQQRLIGRRDALNRAWNRFISSQQGRWPESTLQRAKHLDYVMRTAIFEGHLGRGCNAYGACERNIIALSLRNRARENCLSYQGCRFEGDFQGVATKVSQYNIWDEYLTQISGLTSCFLRQDLGSAASASGAQREQGYYPKLQQMYQQNRAAVQRILFGDDQDLQELFPGTALASLKRLRHYYHAPAMGQCFPTHDRVEYLSGAVARNGNDFALLANTRIKVDQRTEGGYLFRDFVVDVQPDRDVIRIVDSYPGFVVDSRKVDLKPAASCPPYGIPAGCRFNAVGRYRKTPSWLNSGTPLAIRCRVLDQGEQCQSQGEPRGVTVGEACDTEMRPVTGIR